MRCTLQITLVIEGQGTQNSPYSSPEKVVMTLILKDRTLLVKLFNSENSDCALDELKKFRTLKALISDYDLMSEFSLKKSLIISKRIVYLTCSFSYFCGFWSRDNKENNFSLLPVAPPYCGGYALNKKCHNNLSCILLASDEYGAIYR